MDLPHVERVARALLALSDVKLGWQGIVVCVVVAIGCVSPGGGDQRWLCPKAHAIVAIRARLPGAGRLPVAAASGCT